jgi:hypothetical protein
MSAFHHRLLVIFASAIAFWMNSQITVVAFAAQAESAPKKAAPAADSPKGKQPAAKPKKAERPPAYLTVEEAGPDYQLQGEYRGWQRSMASDRTSESIGLQVIALGEGNFAAAKFYGGLPGSGGERDRRFEYVGRREGDLVRLRSRDYVVEVDGSNGLIFALDGRRAGQLKKVTRVSPTMGAKPPEGAIILFDGSGHDLFVDAKMTPEGWLQQGTQTRDAYGDFCLHGEFRLPFKPLGRGQDRGNSGFYIQGRYEVQVLDSFGLEGVENECGAIYRVKRPDTNVCLPPLAWQTYDIDFTMPRFDEQGKKISDMRITVWQNGVLIHDHVDIPHKTGGGSIEGPEPLPTKLQDHNNPVVYRNLWLLPKEPGRPVPSEWVKLPVSGPPVPIRSYEPAGVVMVGPYVP